MVVIRLINREDTYVFHCPDCGWESEEMSRFFAFAAQLPSHFCKKSPKEQESGDGAHVSERKRDNVA